MQFLRRRFHVIVALALGPVGLFVMTTAAHAHDSWSP